MLRGTSGGGTLNCSQGECSGSGTIGGDANNDGGTISPGNSPGEMSIEGDFSQSEEGTLSMEIAGTDAGSDHDVLTVDGEATLDGTLAVSLLDGFQPEKGNSFDLLNFESFTGEFDHIELPDLGPGLAWDTSLLRSIGVLAVVPEPGAFGLLLLAGVACFLLRWNQVRRPD